MRTWPIPCSAAWFFCISLVPAAFAQQINAGMPYHSVNNGYFESYNVAWGLNWPGGFAQFGSPGQPIPPFGKYDPSAGFQTGWRFGGGGFHGSVRFSAAQGSYQSFSSQTPFVTLTNGYPGGFYDYSLSPFVTGWVPVVGGSPLAGPMLLPPGAMPQDNTGDPLPPERAEILQRLLAEQKANNLPAEKPDPPPVAMPARESTADRPAPSVAEAKRLYELEKDASNEEAKALFERAKAAEEEGKPQVAKIYYQMVVRRAQGELKQTAQRRLEELKAERR